MRAVLDTNVLLRIILTTRPDGVAGALWQLLCQRAFVLVTSEALLDELRSTLLVPELAELHGWGGEEVALYVDSIRDLAVVVPGTATVEAPELARRDPTDLPLLAAAVEGRADFLVSQDDDLLSLLRFEGVQIVDPLGFLRQLRSRLGGR